MCRVLRDLIHIGDRGEMQHGICPLERPLSDRGIAEVAQHRIDIGVIRGRDQVKDPRFVACRAQLVDDVRADEAGSTGDEGLHRSSGR